MKLKLFIILVLINLETRLFCDIKLHLQLPSDLKLSLESDASDGYILKDSKTSYFLEHKKDFIFEGACLLQNDNETNSMALVLGFKTIAQSRDLFLSGYELVFSSQATLAQTPTQLEYLKPLIFEAGRMLISEQKLVIQEELKAYGSSLRNRNGQMLPLLKEYKVRFSTNLQISAPKWPIPSSSLDYLNLAHAMMSNKQPKKAASLYLLGLRQQSRQLDVLNTALLNQVNYDLAINLVEIGHLTQAQAVLRSLGLRLARGSHLRSPVFKLYKRVLKELGED